MAKLDVSTLDPSVPAPPMKVAVNPRADSVGHGRTLPLIGGRRSYMYDVLCEQGTSRIYADSPTGVLRELIKGYAAAADALDAAEATGDRDQLEQAFSALFLLRAEHATAVRIELQRQLNTDARATSRWDRLSTEEQGQLSAAEDGRIPVGVIIEEESVDIDGHPILVDRGIWETPFATLVIDRGDYGLFDPDCTPEPTCELAEQDENGQWVVIVTNGNPDNMIILDSTDDESYLDSLEAAGVISIDLYPPDAEDSFYLDAVRLGQNIMESEDTDLTGWVGYHPELAADATDADHIHAHHHGQHDHGHPHDHQH